MKNLRRISILLMALVLLMTQALLIPASAAKETEDYVLLNDPSDFVVLTNPDGTLLVYLLWDIPGEKDIRIEVPETINGRKVTEIRGASYSTIPQMNYRVKSVVIPDSVTKIADYTFRGCAGLTSITLPSGLTSIGEQAFDCCYALADITLPDSVTSVGANAFNATAFINDANNWDQAGVLYNGKCLIAAKSSLSGNYAVKEGTKTIAARAFSNCKSLASVTLPDSVTSIGVDAFTGTAYFNDANNWDQDGVLYNGKCLIAAKSSLSGDYAIKEGTQTIAVHALSGCTGLTSVNIPNGVTCIEAGAFAGLTNLRSVTIPNSVTSIKDEAFSKCSALEEITIPDGVTYIGMYAFSGCIALKSVVIPDSVTSLDAGAFNGCKMMKSVILSTGLSSIPQETFSGCGLTSVVIPGNIKSINEDAFSNCTALESITMLDGVETIGREAFMYDNATSITIPSSVRTIPGTAFWTWDEISRTVYYVGTPEQWSQMNVESKEILNANRIYLTEYESSGVKVTAPVGTVDAQAEFRAVLTDIGNIQLVLMDGFDLSTAVAYDLFFEKNGTRVQPNGAVTVSIPVPAELNNKKVKVFYADANGNLTDMNAQFIYGSMIFTTDHFSTYIAMEESKYSVSTDKPAYKADEAITVTVKAPDTVQKVYLTSETGTGLVSTRTKVDNGDGTATWTLTLSLGTIGERVLSVFADGEDTGADAELEIVYPAASGKVEVISAVSPAEVKANEPFTVTITTNAYAKNVRLFNENGAGLVPFECTCVKQGDDLVWTYTVAVGTVGQRTFMAKAAAEDNVYIGKKLVLLSVG